LKTLITALLSSAVIFGMFFVSSHSPQREPVAAVLPRVADIEDTVILQGTVAEEGRERYYSGGPAVITGLYVSVGERVMPGQLLMCIEETKSENSLLRSDVEKLLEKAYEDILSGANSNDVTDELAAAFASAVPEEKTVRSAIYSRKGGTVMALGGRQGETVSGMLPLIEVSDLSELVVSAMAAEDDVGSISEGMECLISVPALEKEMNGYVRTIMPYAKTTGYLTGGAYTATEVIIEAAAPSKLSPGYSASVIFSVPVSDNAILLPYECVARDGEQLYVLALMDGVITRCDVKTGWELESEVEILDGIDKGVPVLLDPDPLLEGKRARN